MFDQRTTSLEMKTINVTSRTTSGNQQLTRALEFLQSGDISSFTSLIQLEANTGDSNHWINQEHTVSGVQGRLIDIAIKNGRTEFVRELVAVNARRDLHSSSTGLTPLHVAAELGNIDMLRLLIGDEDDTVDFIHPAIHARQSRRGWNGWTPMHVAVHGNGVGHLKCLEYLLEISTDVDVLSEDLQTPLFLAIQEKNKEAAIKLIEHGASLEIKCGRQTLKEYLRQNLPQLDTTKISVLKPRSAMEKLKDRNERLLKEAKAGENFYSADISSFEFDVKHVSDQGFLDDWFTMACKRGLHQHVQILLNKGADPNNTKFKMKNPILQAAFEGFHQVLQVLKDDEGAKFDVTDNENMETILHVILKKESDRASSSDYQKCLDIVLEDITQIKSIINKRDDLDNTALHYATQKWPQSTVRKLLEIGANIGIKNVWEEVPINKILPETMENFLDEFCLQSEGDVVHTDFSLTFIYDFLAPDKECLPKIYRNQDSEKQGLLPGKGWMTHALPETESLWYMGQSREHRRLLKHPVITSFLWYKWKRIRRWFNRNLRFYTLFVFILTWYIFEHFGIHESTEISGGGTAGYGVFDYFLAILSVFMIVFIIRDWIRTIKCFQIKDTDEEMEDKVPETNSCLKITQCLVTHWFEVAFISFLVFINTAGLFKPSMTVNSNSQPVLRIALIILLICLIIREVFQMLTSLKRYLTSPENWMVFIMIILVTFLICNEGGDFEVNRHLAAISILFSWSELVIIIGKHPKLKRFNIYITMFYKVMKDFFFLISWYSLFLIAFGLGFYIMLHDYKDAADQQPEEAKQILRCSDGTQLEVKPEEYAFFNKTWLSLIKTTSMFIGELEFGDIPVNLDSPLAPLSYLFFLSFVFLIVVVLMNLMLGLAVSDTGIIREKAEIYSYLLQVETISYLESMMLGDPFNFLKNVPAMLSSLPSCSLFRLLYRSPTVRKIFTKTGPGILLFYNYLPNKRSRKIKPNKNTRNWCCMMSAVCCCGFSIFEMDPEIISSAKQIVVNLKSSEDENNKQDKLDKLQMQMEEILKRLDAMTALPAAKI